MTSMDRFVPRAFTSRASAHTMGMGAVLALVAACSSSSGSGGTGTSTQTAASTCSPAGAPAAGPADDHCTVNGMAVVQPTDQASCNVDAAAGDDSGTGDDGSVAEDGGGPTGDCDPSDYGPTMYGYSGSDDDCKYNVTWSSTDICEGGNGVDFTLTVHSRVDGSPVLKANPYIEAVKGCVIPAAGEMTTTELGNGQYKIGPIIFPVSGLWVIRFHIFGLECSDALPTSPHGHAAFFVNVP